MSKTEKRESEVLGVNRESVRCSLFILVDVEDKTPRRGEHLAR